MFAHYRLVGEGINDGNLQADVSQVGYSFSFKSQTPVDLLVFTDYPEAAEAYNCYTSASQQWVQHKLATPCDFMHDNAVMKHAVTEYQEESSAFLTRENLHSDAFIVVDNTGWYSALTNELDPSGQSDVMFNLGVTTEFSDNSMYNTVFVGSCVAIGILTMTLLISLCCYRWQVKKYNDFMEEKRAYKQDEYLRKQSSLAEDMTALRAKSQHQRE